MGKLRVETVVFLSLILDLFAFTVPLPLFPRIIEWYTVRESNIPDGFLNRTLSFVSTLRGFFYAGGSKSQRWDIVLLGGLMGSLFSTLQFIVSPWIGSLSDVYGRRNILLLTMIGNILSALVWIKSTTFASYMLSRAIGGLSEGNVQLAIAILSDITTPKNRAKALAHIGIAFAICFIIGPPIGAYFASRPMPISLGASMPELTVYATPAIITLVLLVAETAFLAFALPETRGKAPISSRKPSPERTNGHAADHTSSASKLGKPAVSDVASRLKMLSQLKTLHFVFLGIFSGVEFTLTFLTFDLFDWNNSRNGGLIAFIGLISAVLQGGYVRRAIPKIGEGVMARRGVSSCTVALAVMAVLPQLKQESGIKAIFVAAVFLAFTSATVVNSLTALASLQCDHGIDGEESKGEGADIVANEPKLAKGRALGEFRSAGQLGRAIGPLLACASYWTFGPSTTYVVSAAAMTAVSMSMGSLRRS